MIIESKKNPKLYVFGNEIDGTIAAVRRLIDSNQSQMRIRHVRQVRQNKAANGQLNRLKPKCRSAQKNRNSRPEPKNRLAKTLSNRPMVPVPKLVSAKRLPTRRNRLSGKRRRSILRRSPPILRMSTTRAMP